MSQESDFNAKFDPEAVFKQKLINHVNFDVLTGGSDDKEDENLSPFEKIRKRMTAVTKDGGVMKRVSLIILRYRFNLTQKKLYHCHYM